MEEPSTSHLNQLLKEEVMMSVMEKTKEKLIAELASIVVSYAEFRVVKADELEQSFQCGDFDLQTGAIIGLFNLNLISEVSANNLLVSFEWRGRIFCSAKWDQLTDQFINRIKPNLGQSICTNSVSALAWFIYLLEIPPDVFADETSSVANFADAALGLGMVSGVFCGYDFVQSCFTLEIKIIKRKSGRQQAEFLLNEFD